MATPFPNWFDVRDFTSIQATINAAAAATTGGTVYIPSGIYTLPSSSGNTLVVPANQTQSPLRPIRLLGDGPDQTVIVQSLSADILQILGDQTIVEGITFQGVANPTSGRGIVIGSTTQSNTINKLYIRNCCVQQTYSYGLHVLQGASSRFTSIFASYTDCRFSNNLHDAAILIEQYNSSHYFRGCNVEDFGDHGIKLTGCEGISFIGGAVEGPKASTQPFIYGNQAVDVMVQGYWFEDSLSSPQWCIFLENACHGWVINGCTFRRLNTLNPMIVSVGNAQFSPCKGVVVLNPRIVVALTGTITANNFLAIGNTETEAFLMVDNFNNKRTCILCA